MTTKRNSFKNPEPTIRRVPAGATVQKYGNTEITYLPASLPVYMSNHASVGRQNNPDGTPGDVFIQFDSKQSQEVKADGKTYITVASIARVLLPPDVANSIGTLLIKQTQAKPTVGDPVLPQPQGKKKK